VTIAFLYLSGKMPSERQRFTMVVIGRIRAGRQDFKSEVGMGSREQVALDEEEIAIVIM